MAAGQISRQATGKRPGAPKASQRLLWLFISELEM